MRKSAWAYHTVIYTRRWWTEIYCTKTAQTAVGTFFVNGATDVDERGLWGRKHIYRLDTRIIYLSLLPFIALC